MRGNKPAWFRLGRRAWQFCLVDLRDTNRFMALTNLVLPTSPYLWIDTEYDNARHRFYRATLKP